MDKQIFQCLKDLGRFESASKKIEEEVRSVLEERDHRGLVQKNEMELTER